MISRPLIPPLHGSAPRSTLSILLALFGSLLNLHAADERAFLLTGSITPDGSSVTLNWFPTESPSPVYVYRRTLGEVGGATWVELASLADGVTSYTDNTTVAGVAYEYQVYRSYQNVDAQKAGGHWTTGVEVAAEEDRGICLLIVDETYATTLAGELERLELDLVGDGWTVVRRDQPRHGNYTDGQAQAMRSWIQNEVAKNPNTRHTLYLFGHVPMVESGYIAPDGHSQTHNATDTYFADLDGTWTDTGTYGTTVNVPGDGIFDQNSIPGDRQVEIEFGRVDLSDLPAYSRDEFTLLRDYLNKNHAYRHNRLPYNMEAYASKMAYDVSKVEEFALHNIVGSDKVSYGSHHVQGEEKPWLWGVDFGDAGGANYADYTIKNIFAVNFGSHKDNWENSDTPNRMLLGQPWYCLANVWGVRPNWYIHHMAMGKTIGYSNFRTVNNLLESGDMDYTEADDYGNWYRNYIHINLMGDPTLRVFMIDPPSNLTATDQGASVDLSWTASTASGLIGYKVYRSADRLGPYTPLNGGNPVVGTAFTDNSPISDAWYMVRAYRLEEVAAGSFYNLSQGVFVEQSGNQIPVATTADFSVDEDASAVINFSATDGDSDTLTFSPLKQPSHGDITWNGSHFVYAPAPDFNGTDTITYTIFDGKASVTDSITVTVNPTPDGVSAPASQTVAGIAEQPVPLDLEFSDPDGDADTFTVVTPPAHGTLLIQGSEVFYQANSGYEGQDSFVYTISDGTNTSSNAAVTVNVSNFGEGTLSDGFTDNNASDWNFVGLDQVWSITDGVLNFTEWKDDRFLAPGPGATDWTDTEIVARVQSKKLDNSIGLCVRDDGTNNVSFFISGDNGAELRSGTKSGTQYAADASYATGGANEILLDTWYELRLKVVGNLAYAWIDGAQVFNAIDVSSAPSAGGAGLNVENNNDDHLFDDVTIVYVNQANDPPAVSIAPPGTGEESTPLALEATVTDDGSYTPLSFAWDLVSGPGNAVFSHPAGEDTSVTVDTTGEYTFRLRANDGEFIRTDEVTVTFLSALAVLTDTASVDINEGSTAVVGVKLKKDPGQTLTVTTSRTVGDADLSVQSGDTLVFDSTNWDTWQNLVLTAAHDPDNANGSATFTLDADLPSAVDATVTATEQDDDDAAPVIAEGPNTTVTMSEDGSPAAFNLTLNASDIHGDTLTWSISAQASNGTASASGTGTAKAISYSPNADFFGSDSFEVQVSDPQGKTDAITVNVTVEAVNDAPALNNPIADQQTMAASAYAFTFASDVFSDTEDAGLSYTADLAGGGSLPAWLNFNGSTRTFSGTPQSGDIGTLEVRVTATDSGSLTAADTFLLTVQNADLVLHYTFDEGSGTAIGDSSGGGNDHSTTFAEATWTALGNIGGALGTDDGTVQVGSPGIVPANAANLNFHPRADEFSISAWVKVDPTVTNLYRYLFDKTDGTTQFQVRVWNSWSSIRVASGNTTATLSLPGGTVLNDGEWHLLTFVNYNDNGTWRFRLYHNDGTAFVEGLTGDAAPNAAALTLGAASNGANRWPGNIDDFRIYASALSPEQVATLHAQSDALPPYTTWSNGISWSGGDSSETADPDSDGLSNLMEYALDLDPVTASTNPTTSQLTGAPQLELSFNRARSELTYTVEASDDLSTWTPIATNPGNLGETVTVTDSVTAGPSHPSRFLRVRVEQP